MSGEHHFAIRTLREVHARAGKEIALRREESDELIDRLAELRGAIVRLEGQRRDALLAIEALEALAERQFSAAMAADETSAAAASPVFGKGAPRQ